MSSCYVVSESTLAFITLAAMTFMRLFRHAVLTMTVLRVIFNAIRVFVPLSAPLDRTNVPLSVSVLHRDSI